MSNGSDHRHLRSKKIEDSIRARYAALKQAVHDKDCAVPALISGCRTATSFQLLDLPDLGIHRIGSRNTMVKYANRVLAGPDSAQSDTGWHTLDSLRKAVRKKHLATENPRSVSARNKRLAQAQEALRMKLDQSERLMLAQSKAYLWLLQELRGLALSQNLDSRARDRLRLLLHTHEEVFGRIFESDAIGHVREANIVEMERK